MFGGNNGGFQTRTPYAFYFSPIQWRILICQKSRRARPRVFRVLFPVSFWSLCVLRHVTIMCCFFLTSSFVTSRNRYPSRSFCLAATTPYNTLQVQDLVASVSTSRLGMRDHACVFDCIVLQWPFYLSFSFVYICLTLLLLLTSSTNCNS